MGIFNFGFFGTREPRGFRYTPLTYDEDKERLKDTFGSVDGSLEKEKETTVYVPGAHIKKAMNVENRPRKETRISRIQKIIGAVTLILVFLVIMLIAKYYPLIWQ